jgi:tryptophanyl-tRNA synthetase
MVIDWLAVGIDPAKSTLFIQSRLPQHAELHVLLSMITPLSWLERVPTYKDQQQQLKDKDLSTYGFLGYPLLQSADVVMYRAAFVPVGEDQVPHIELTREIARRFNFLYGREPDYEERAQEAIKKLGKKAAASYRTLRLAYVEQGDHEALRHAHTLLEQQGHVALTDRERLLGYLEGGGRVILPEPQPLLTPASKMPGIDGRKMSKSYGNTIGLREDPDSVTKRLRTMPTDPARVRRTDPGEPEKCPVWSLHQVYSDDATKAWVQQGCRSAGIGCLECKQPVIDAMLAELAPIRERALTLSKDVNYVKDVVAEGTKRARTIADETLMEVRGAMGLEY